MRNTASAPLAVHTRSFKFSFLSISLTKTKRFAYALRSVTFHAFIPQAHSIPEPRSAPIPTQSVSIVFVANGIRASPLSTGCVGARRAQYPTQWTVNPREVTLSQHVSGAWKAILLATADYRATAAGITQRIAFTQYEVGQLVSNAVGTFPNATARRLANAADNEPCSAYILRKPNPESSLASQRKVGRSKVHPGRDRGW